MIVSGVVNDMAHWQIIIYSLVDFVQMAGFPRSWKILKFETILESHGKVMDFCLFSRSHGKLIFQGKVMEKSWNCTQTVSSVHDVWLWQSCGLHIQVHYILSRSLVNVYINVCFNFSHGSGCKGRSS